MWIHAGTCFPIDIGNEIGAEKVENNRKALKDYKFYCFAGVPIYCQVISERFTEETVDFFDMEWKHQEFTGMALPYKPFHATPIPVPKCFVLMKESARKLSKGIPFSRIDFYEVSGRMYFGEITLFPASGFGEFKPAEWNRILGDMIPLDICMQTHKNSRYKGIVP